MIVPDTEMQQRCSQIVDDGGKFRDGKGGNSTSHLTQWISFGLVSGISGV